MSDNRSDRNDRSNRSSVRGGARMGMPAAYRKSPQQYPQGRRLRPVWFVVVMDILFLGLALNVFAIIYTLPSSFDDVQTIIQPTATHTSTMKPSPSPAAAVTDSAAPTDSQPPENTDGTVTPTDPPPTDQPVDEGMWGAKFPDKFTGGEVEKTANSYKSRDINITLQKVQENGVTYFFADIYVRNLQNIHAILANDKPMGRNQRESQVSMAKRSNAILAINTDNYGFMDKGYAVRNGQLGRSLEDDADIMALYADGTMKTFAKGKYKLSDIDNSWQVCGFGPMLLDGNGQPMEKFNSVVTPKNPRTAIGYYEPGHYCFVLVDGRQSGYSVGLSMKELSKLMFDRGCQVAFNLDGGQSSMMTFMGELVNKPYQGGREVSDILTITETN